MYFILYEKDTGDAITYAITGPAKIFLTDLVVSLDNNFINTKGASSRYDDTMGMCLASAIDTTVDNISAVHNSTTLDLSATDWQFEYYQVIKPLDIKEADNSFLDVCETYFGEGCGKKTAAELLTLGNSYVTAGSATEGLLMGQYATLAIVTVQTRTGNWEYCPYDSNAAWYYIPDEKHDI